jgi:hypothetical protein
MMWRRLSQRWNDFFFKLEPPTPVALFRILYGLLVTANLLMLRREWLTWYGPRGFMSLETMRRMAIPPQINFFYLIPATDTAANTFFWAFLGCAILLTLGFMTRFASVAVYMCLLSIQMRNVYILNGGDAFLRVTCFFLMFAPAGSVLSIDHLLRVRREEGARAVPLTSPWALRLIQIQVAVVYFSTFYWKTMGAPWINGTALYYILRLDDFRRFPMPHSLALLKFLTWLTLFIEFAMGVLVWFKELRYPVLIATLCLHLGIEYAMNLPIFEWIMIASLVTFVYPEDLARFGSRLSRYIHTHRGEGPSTTNGRACSTPLEVGNPARQS